MFGLIRKKKVLEKMKAIKDGNRAKDLYAKYPPKDKEQEKLNCCAQGYEDGTDNFYNELRRMIEH